MIGIVQHEGGAGREPQELPVANRKLDVMLGQSTLCDKGWQPYWMNLAARARNCIGMVLVASQADGDELRARPGILGGVNTNPLPLFDEGQAELAMEFRRAEQQVHITPFALA